MAHLRLVLLAVGLTLGLAQVAQASVGIARLSCAAIEADMAGLCQQEAGIIKVQQGRGGGGGSNAGEGAGIDREKPTRRAPRAGRDVVPASDGSPEYIMLVNRGQAATAARTLQAAGATLLRQRSLPQLGQQMMFFAFPRNLSLGQARALLASRAPSAVIDLHHIYRRSAGPRLYHAAMLGDDPGRVCRLGRAVRVGIIDGPVNPAHPALRGVKVVRKSTLARGERSGSAGHGTAVAGLIAGSASAGPLSGLAPGVQVYAAEAFGSGNRGDGGRLESVAVALDWLLGSGVRLVNMSFAGAGNQAFAKLLGLSAGRGAVMVAAAGNNNSGAEFYPAASQYTIAITAVDAAGRLYRQANYGRHIEFAAPGVDLYVASGNGGGYRSGTSFAAPVVTALLARKAARGGVSLGSARSFLRARARDLGPGGRDTKYGYGLVQSGGC